MWIMIIQDRPEPLDLHIFRVLLARMELSDKDISNYAVRQKGYVGELKSDEWLKRLTDHWLVLHGLLLEYDGSKFQIDTLIIAYEKMYILDVKYYEGDYYLEGEKWFTQTNLNMKNPLHQLERCETLFRKLLLKLGYNHSIESYLVFNHPEFHLYTTTIKLPIVFPTQLNRFLKKLNSRPVKLNQRYHNLAQQLASLHIVESPYSRVPTYNYHDLKKNNVCPNCGTFSTRVNYNKLVCRQCDWIEEVDVAVLRNVKEFVLLFPDRKITTNGIYEWCGGFFSKKTIRRVLMKNYKLDGFGPSSNFVELSN
jgi:hypothetical protein